jgi:translation initiation factor 3 subunit I
LVSGAGDNVAKLWQVATGKCLKTWVFNTTIKRVAFSEDDSMVLMVAEQHMGFIGAATIFNVIPGVESERAFWKIVVFFCALSRLTKSPSEALATIFPQGSKVTVAAWGALNKYIITGHENGSVSLYNWKV